MNYLYPRQVIFLYERIIARTGGTIGLRDQGLLESAVYRPQASFGGQDLYPDLFSKVAALGHSLIHNHPFVDGNKRIGLATMHVMLRLNGYDIHASTDAKCVLTIHIAEGRLTEEHIADWLKTHRRPRASQ